jgi:hypothetical protein
MGLTDWETSYLNLVLLAKGEETEALFSFVSP